MYIKKIQKKLVDLGNDKNTFKRSKMQQNGVKICVERDGEYWYRKKMSRDL